jgi:hypothetical protein
MFFLRHLFFIIKEMALGVEIEIEPNQTWASRTSSICQGLTCQMVSWGDEFIQEESLRRISYQ